MDYEKKYKEAIERAKKWRNALNVDKMPTFANRVIDEIFPELAESEDERIKKKLIENFKYFCGDFPNTTKWGKDDDMLVKDILAWLEKQGVQKSIINVPPREVILSIWDLGNEWKELTNGCFSAEYGTQLDYIQKHWHESEYYLKEKQGENIDQANKEYWRGYCKNKQEVLDKYAEIEKQGEQKPIWHNEDEEPQRGSLILLIMQSGTPIVAKIIEPNHTFNHGERWAYIDDLLEKQGNKYVNIDIKSMVRLKSQGQGNLENNPLISQQDEYELVAKKVEPKFKVGDWVVFNNKHQSIYQVEKIEDGYYILRHTHGGTFRVCILHDKSLRLWTTQDAKDGDVLVGKINGDKYIIIFKRIKDGWVETHGYYNGTLSRFCAPSHMFCRDYQGTFTPATQEQRDLLFKRMKEKGYEKENL